MKKIILLCILIVPLLWAQEPEENVISVSVRQSAKAEDDFPELDIEMLLRRRIVKLAQEYLGVPYKYAGVDPDGFDCSGFVYFIFREAAGMDVSRSTTGIWNSGKKIALSQVRSGDVLVFTTVRAGASHTGIVLENNSQGVIFIHAASQGSKTGIIISNMNESYYKTRFMGARSYF
ncbi:MAG: NlpC/P60 family protein [Treponema sp.]|nr:NlpC/P60 family protein [Treponema sp.]